MQGANPSEILEGLRNDGRGRHHRNELEKAIAKLERTLAELKADCEKEKKTNAGRHDLTQLK
jgi:hypothetical protein